MQGALESVEGVEVVEISCAKGIATVNAHGADPEDIIAALEKVGYGASVKKD